MPKISDPNLEKKEEMNVSMISDEDDLFLEALKQVENEQIENNSMMAPRIPSRPTMKKNVVSPLTKKLFSKTPTKRRRKSSFESETTTTTTTTKPPEHKKRRIIHDSAPLSTRINRCINGNEQQHWKKKKSGRIDKTPQFTGPQKLLKKSVLFFEMF